MALAWSIALAGATMPIVSPFCRAGALITARGSFSSWPSAGRGAGSRGPGSGSSAPAGLVTVCRPAFTGEPRKNSAVGRAIAITTAQINHLDLFIVLFTASRVRAQASLRSHRIRYRGLPGNYATNSGRLACRSIPTRAACSAAPCPLEISAARGQEAPLPGERADLTAGSGIRPAGSAMVKAPCSRRPGSGRPP